MVMASLTSPHLVDLGWTSARRSVFPGSRGRWSPVVADWNLVQRSETLKPLATSRSPVACWNLDLREGVHSHRFYGLKKRGRHVKRLHWSDPGLSGLSKWKLFMVLKHQELGGGLDGMTWIWWIKWMIQMFFEALTKVGKNWLLYQDHIYNII